MSEKAAEQPSAIPHGGGFFQHPNQVDLVFDFRRQRSARKILEGAFAARMLDQPVFDFEEVADFFEHDLRVGFSDGIEAVAEELIKQGRRIGHVEVAGQHQTSRSAVTSSVQRMAMVFGMSAVGAVAQVAEHHFAQERSDTVSFRAVEFGIGQVIDLIHSFRNHRQQLVQVARPGAAGAGEIGLASAVFKSDHANPRAILAAVALLLQEQGE